MWDFIRRNPWVAWTAAILVVIIVVGLNATTIATLLWSLITAIIEKVALPLVVLALMVWGFLKIMGHGTLWGKKGGDKK